MKQFKKSVLVIVATSFLVLQLTGCSVVNQLAGVKDPEFKVSNVSLSGLSFDKADLLLDVNVHNPNNIALKFAGFNYDLLINENSFVKGYQDLGQTIQANSNSNFKVPIQLNYKNLYDTFQSLMDKDNVDYNVLLDFDFDLPVVGKTTFPINEKGSLPLPKVPAVKFQNLKLDKLSLTTADLNLDIVIENPNNFDLTINNFNYDLNVDGKSWAKSISAVKKKIPKKGKNVLSIPVSLNFLTMGQTVYQTLTSSEPLDYSLSGKMDLDTSIPIMKKLALPVDRKGKLNILR